MGRQRCNTCKGEYVDTLPDGLRYFHACPPLSAVELAAAVAAGKVVLPAGETVDQAVTLRTYERANKRNENVIGRDATGAVIVSPGSGVTPVATPPPPAPVVVP